MKKIYEAGREFQVWRYTVSHRSLLLRSVKPNPESSRIDIYFGHVEAMFLRPGYDGLSIYQAEEDDLAAVRDRFGVPANADTTFLIGPSGVADGDRRARSEVSGLVISGPPTWHEDNGSAKDPSFFQDAMGNLL